MDIEHLDSVVARVGDVQNAARLIEHHVLQAFVSLAVRIGLIGGRIVGRSGHRINHAALVRLPGIHEDPDIVRYVDRFHRRYVQVECRTLQIGSAGHDIGSRLANFAAASRFHRQFDRGRYQPAGHFRHQGGAAIGHAHGHSAFSEIVDAHRRARHARVTLIRRQKNGGGFRLQNRVVVQRGKR